MFSLFSCSKSPILPSFHFSDTTSCLVCYSAHRFAFLYPMTVKRISTPWIHTKTNLDVQASIAGWTWRNHNLIPSDFAVIPNCTDCSSYIAGRNRENRNSSGFCFLIDQCGVCKTALLQVYRWRWLFCLITFLAWVSLGFPSLVSISTTSTLSNHRFDRIRDLTPQFFDLCDVIRNPIHRWFWYVLCLP